MYTKVCPAWSSLGDDKGGLPMSRSGLRDYGWWHYLLLSSSNTFIRKSGISFSKSVWRPVQLSIRPPKTTKTMATGNSIPCCSRAWQHLTVFEESLRIGLWVLAFLQKLYAINQCTCKAAHKNHTWQQFVAELRLGPSALLHSLPHRP